jgi:phosphoserine phosphatase
MAAGYNEPSDLLFQERHRSMIIVSDLIGTVTTGSPVIGLTRWVRNHQSALRADLYLGRQLPAYLLAKWGLVDMQKLGQRLMFSALPLIKNPSPESLVQMGEWSVEYELWPKRRLNVLHQLTSYVKTGARVYLASSVYEPTVKAFAGRIGAYGIGTPLEITDGKVGFAEPLTADEQKVEKVLSQLGVDKVDAAYGDTWADIPLLERADRPIAIYPDAVLKATAVERGWEIFGDRNARQARS